MNAKVFDRLALRWLANEINSDNIAPSSRGPFASVLLSLRAPGTGRWTDVAV